MAPGLLFDGEKATSVTADSVLIERNKVLGAH